MLSSFAAYFWHKGLLVVVGCLKISKYSLIRIYQDKKARSSKKDQNIGEKSTKKHAEFHSRDVDNIAELEYTVYKIVTAEKFAGSRP